MAGASGIGTETVGALAGPALRSSSQSGNPAATGPILRESPTAEAAALDLADLRSVRAFCDDWSGPVAAVVANAGVMALPERQVSAQGWEVQLAINYLGHFALVHGLHDTLRAAEEPRVVVVSSGAQRLYGFDFDDPQFERSPYDPMAAYA
ncbi:SDR family NAD(P)-dependent oxidoreductase [Kitasatospora sp. NPDC059577]|uniref:SDR family NAD(P)-dependent oxidoreductase n=1 Tax=Kitasatospora sp. NPDC059577 TaxID=3346873 RepID=UPI003675374A